ncbi:MAG: hypothetical protein IPM91_09765 [Bacteroidetes bacterium]|nr:hypothetical protein [Bacteroidota bacterium]
MSRKTIGIEKPANARLGWGSAKIGSPRQSPKSIFFNKQNHFSTKIPGATTSGIFYSTKTLTQKIHAKINLLFLNTLYFTHHPSSFFQHSQFPLNPISILFVDS